MKNNNKYWLRQFRILSVGVIIISIMLSILIIIQNNKIEELSSLKNPLKEIKDSLVNTCHIGCIYSTKFYYNNTNFDSELYDCLLYCQIEIGELDYFKR